MDLKANIPGPFVLILWVLITAGPGEAMGGTMEGETQQGVRRASTVAI
jgi:hypothetical protein